MFEDDNLNNSATPSRSPVFYDMPRPLRSTTSRAVRRGPLIEENASRVSATATHYRMCLTRLMKLYIQGGDALKVASSLFGGVSAGRAAS